MAKAIMVFTGRGITQIIDDGGSQAWALDPKRARKCEYLVCVQNYPGEAWAKPEAPQGTAFLLGRISGVEYAGDEHGDNRYIVEISEYAELPNIENLWHGWRNPVKYTSLDELYLDPERLTWHRMPVGGIESHVKAEKKEDRPTGAVPLTIPQAKAGLALQFGVDVSAIEITIKG
ncbi:MAG: hypothetical protein AB7P20_09450 [Rhizobiaceae bacterium]